MNVVLMDCEVFFVANPVVGESALPDFPLAAKDCAQAM
jgi:hypothetical protein